MKRRQRRRWGSKGVKREKLTQSVFAGEHECASTVVLKNTCHIVRSSARNRHRAMFEAKTDGVSVRGSTAENVLSRAAKKFLSLSAAEFSLHVRLN